MQKEAWVVGIEGEQVRLRYLRHSACNNCGACSFMGQGEQEILLPNDLNLQVGDKVEVGMSSKSFLKANILLYVLPLFFFLLGYLVVERLMIAWQLSKWQEVGGAIGAVLFFFLSYKGINLYDRRVEGSEQYQIKVIRIIKRAVKIGAT